jgi:hypothetical protein
MGPHLATGTHLLKGLPVLLSSLSNAVSIFMDSSSPGVLREKPYDVDMFVIVDVVFQM